MPAPAPSTNRLHIGLLTVIVCAVSLPYLILTFSMSDEHVVTPLDDAYITFQYARQIARGQPYQYNDGDPPTTGMTSPLYGFLLAGAYLLGFQGDWLPAFAVSTGLAWLALSAWLSHRLTRRFAGENAAGLWPWGAALLVTLTGAVQWGCFNGMETGLFTVLTLGALDAYFAHRPGWCALWLGLAGLARPEGLILAGLTLGIGVVHEVARARSDRRASAVRVLSVAVLVGLLPMGVNWWLTGTASSAGLQAKSWMLNVPAEPLDIARSVWLSYREAVLERFMGLASSEVRVVPPGLLALMGLGWGALGLRRRWNALALTAGWFLTGTLGTATLITATWHLGRYQVPFIPLGIALSISGVAFVYERAVRRWQRAAVGLVNLALVAASIYSTVRFIGLYHAAVYTIARQQLAIADWLRDNLPPVARVGVHDTGSLRYVGERSTYDLIGLTTADAAIPWRNGSGSVFERMEHAAARPDYFAIYPDVFSIPYLAATDLFAEELFRVDVPDYAVASAGPVQAVWRADWRLADSGAQYYQPDVRERTRGLTAVDTLDVADLDDEEEHNLTWWHEARRPGFPTEVQQFTYRVDPGIEVLDGGRLVTGGLAFDVRTRERETLWLVARLHAHEAGAVRVWVNGQDVGRWAYPPVPGQWLETLFRVPASAVTSGTTHVELRVETGVPDFRHYAPYYLWFLQGEREVEPARIEHRLQATFSSELSLLGFDLPERAWHPGDLLPVTLYWQATVPSQSDAKVFVHLYDRAGQLGPQVDGWPIDGTRPPYTWWVDEPVGDARFLLLPPDLPPGSYSIEVGLYTPEDGVRLPAVVDGVRQEADRVRIAEIMIRE